MSGGGVLMSKYEWGGVESVGAYHERERLCPEGVRVREIAHVHYVKVDTSHTIPQSTCTTECPSPEIRETVRLQVVAILGSCHTW